MGAKADFRMVRPLSGSVKKRPRSKRVFPPRAHRSKTFAMRFLYSHRTRSADGQYVHIRALTDALSARGHDVIMAGPDKDAPKRLSAETGGLALKRMLPGAFYEYAEYGYSLPAMARLVARARPHAPDLIYERYNLFYHAGVWAARRLGLPLILEVNAPLAEERARYGGLALPAFAQKSENAIWRAADVVLPVTNALAENVRAAGVSEDRIAVIQNGVEEAFLRDHDPGPIRARYGLESQTIIGFAGFVRDWHRVDRVLHYMAGAEAPNLHFLLVGDGPARADLESLARRQGLADRMTVTGAVQRADMAAHIAAFDIAVQPAVTPYASPLKLFEYMALGKAIVAPKSANIDEVVAGGEEALLFDMSEDEAFNAALQRFVDDEELRRRIGLAARDRLVRDDRTWSANAAYVEAIAAKLTGI